LHKLDIVQHPRYANDHNDYSISLFTTDTKLVSPPHLMILSRLAAQSPDMLPIAHIA